MNILKVKTRERRIGTLGERKAEKLLRRLGFKTKERSFVAEGHEIDLIMESKSLRIFVEVKTRTVGREGMYGLRPSDAVNIEKMRSIIAAAKIYSSLNPTKKEQRFDIVEIYLDEDEKVVRQEHFESAFTLDTVKINHIRR